MTKKICAEYIWIDGQKPTAKLRSKTKIVDGPVKSLSELPDWGFDGSSTSQAEVGERVLPKWQRVIADAFENTRATELTCELISQTRALSMRMPAKLARQYDVSGFEIWTYFREHR